MGMAEPLGPCVPLRLRVHAGITHADGPPAFPAPQALLDLGDCRDVDRLAGTHPGADGEAVTREGQTHHHRWLVPAPGFVGAPLAPRRERRVPLRLACGVCVIALTGHTGGIPADQGHIGPEESGGAQEARALDGFHVGVEAIQRAGQVVQRQRRGFWEGDPLRPPGLRARQLGEGRGEARRHQRAERQRMGRTPRSPRRQAPPARAHAQCLPQRSGHVDAPQRPSPRNVENLAGWADLWWDVAATRPPTTDALSEAQQHVAIPGVGAAKVVEDVGGGTPLGRVPARLGELVVLHGGTVFVVAFGRSQIHAYTRGVLPRYVKRFF